MLWFNVSKFTTHIEAHVSSVLSDWAPVCQNVGVHALLRTCMTTDRAWLDALGISKRWYRCWYRIVFGITTGWHQHILVAHWNCHSAFWPSLIPYMALGNVRFNLGDCVCNLLKGLTKPGYKEKLWGLHWNQRAGWKGADFLTKWVANSVQH